MAAAQSSTSVVSNLPPILEADIAYTKKLHFATICDMFTAIGGTNKRSLKRSALDKLLFKYRNFYTYPIMRLILPHLDRDRQTYALKESKLAKAFIQILAIAKDSADALRMVNWRQPQRNAVTGKHEGGDFAEAVFNSLKSRCASHATSTVASINAHLDALNSAEDGATRAQILTSLVREATAYEMKWIIRIILKDLKIGLSEAQVFEAFHEDATEMYNITSSLYLVCNQLRDPTIRTSHQGVSLFHPIKPMLAGRKQPEDIGALITNDNTKFVIEQKFDGERVQVHKDGTTIRLFSRNSLEVTDIYPMIRSSLVRHIKARQAIVDGELLVWDPEANAFEPFGRAKSLAVSEKAGAPYSAIAREVGEKKQFCYIAFDLLYLNGEAKMGLPLRARMALLHENIEVRDKVVEIVEQKEIKSEQAVVEALNMAIDARYEGLMVKDINSIYVPNERKDKWTKLKPEYMDGLGDTLDLLILGGLYGSGARKGATISHFLLGVQKSPGVYWSVARVGSGYSDAELRTLQTMLQNYWRPYNPANPPKGIELANSGIKDVPNVWIEPKYSRVLEVLAAQITPSDKYRAGYTLRFPRVKRVRLDKVADQVTTVDELLEMVSHYESRAARTKLTATKEPKPKKAAKTGLFATHALTGLALTKLDEHPEKENLQKSHTSIFKGREFCVINGDMAFRKDFLELLIRNQGGTLVQAPTSQTFVAIAGKNSVKVKLVESKASTNIVWVKWLMTCIQKQRLIPLEPRFMIYTEPTTIESFHNEIDEFGDTYERLTDDAALQDVFDQMEVPWLPRRPAPRASAPSPYAPSKPTANRANKLIPGSNPASQAIVKSEGMDVDFKPDPDSLEILAPLAPLEKPIVVDLINLPDLVAAEEELFGTPWWALFRKFVFYLDVYDTLKFRPRIKRSSSGQTRSVIGPDRLVSLVKQEDVPTAFEDGSSHLAYSPLCLTAPILRFYGATIVDHLDPGIPLDYIVIDSEDRSRVVALQDVIADYEVNGHFPKIVNEQWVHSCVSAKRHIPPSELLRVNSDWVSFQPEDIDEHLATL